MAQTKVHRSSESATARLDGELNSRLVQTLDEHTKLEVQAYDAVDKLVARQAVTEEAAAIVAFEDYAGDDTSPQFDVATSERARDEDEVVEPVSIARIRFEEGDYFEFTAIPQDGEVALVFHGEDHRRSRVAFDELMSPLRLYCSLAPREAPVPWLIAAVDPTTLTRRNYRDCPGAFPIFRS